MTALHAWGFRGIRLGELLDAWQGNGCLPERPVVLTFDDGFRNLIDHAAPVLQDLGWPATVFAVAGYCGRTNDWPSQPPALPRLPLLSYRDLRDLIAAGFEVGAHGVSHAPLPGLPPRAATREIAGARELLQDALGRPVTLFAYPYGLADDASRALVRAHYRGACGVKLAAARPHGDPFELERIDMYYYRCPAFFRLFPTRLGRLYLRLRAAGRRGRAVLVGAKTIGKER
jgi:peptidoglycan/xylan/chitin deacetylase (PgdA/CDA1 family)